MGNTPALVGGEPIRKAPLPYAHHSLDGDDIGAVSDAVSSAFLTGGPIIERFEESLAKTCGVDHAVAVSSGTAALHLAYAAIGVDRTSEVIVPPLTFVATANAVLFQGGTVRFGDIGPDWCLDPGTANRAMSPTTRVVVTVDYAGLPSDTVALTKEIGDIPLVVDAAHSLGGSLNGRPVGSQGTISTLSFHPAKHITTGEGGACLTNDSGLASDMRRLRNHGMTSTAGERSGREWRYDCTHLGYNYRLSEICAALGLSQLQRLEQIVQAREELAVRYDRMLSEIPGVTLPPRPEGRRSAWHLYVISIGDEFGYSGDEVIDGLRAEGIEATRHYPAVPLLSYYKRQGFGQGTSPVAETLIPTLVTLPLFPSMSEGDQEDVVAAITRLYEWQRHSRA